MNEPQAQDDSRSRVDKELQRQRNYVADLQVQRANNVLRQRAHTKEVLASGQNGGLFHQAAFMESMRDLGYRSTSYAYCELIDNAIQAGASEVHVILHCEKTPKTVTHIAILDNGHGMDPAMAREAVRYGGTHRRGDRSGFGTYGNGLLASISSQGQRVDLYTSPQGGDGTLAHVSVDLREIAARVEQGGVDAVPEPTLNESERTNVPQWVKKYADKQKVTSPCQPGTLVVNSKLDRLDYKFTQRLQRELLEQFGLIYRKWLSDDLKIFVNGARVQPLDPLFTWPGHRDPARKENGVRAEDRGTIVIPVNTADHGPAEIRVRFSFMAREFGRKDKDFGVNHDGDNANFRFRILRDFNRGITILRHGRQVDLLDGRLKNLGGTKQWIFKNEDQYWGCEIDFSPSLDHLFRINTSKQRVVPTAEGLKLLEDHGVYDMLVQLRKEVIEDGKRVRREQAERDESSEIRPSIVAVERHETSQTASPRIHIETAAEMHNAEQATQRESRRRAEQASLPIAAVEAVMHEEIQGQGWNLETRTDWPAGSPFMSAEYRINLDTNAGQVVVILNAKHSFYTDLYSSLDIQGKSMVEALLFAIAKQMGPAVNQGGARGTFYEQELANWSQSLAGYLGQLRNRPADDVDLEEEDLDEATDDAESKPATA